ncbi:MAG: hypothetical protein ACK5RO_02730 [Pseudobdellovibrionaceae bacterium]
MKPWLFSFFLFFSVFTWASEEIPLTPSKFQSVGDEYRIAVGKEVYSFPVVDPEMAESYMQLKDSEKQQFQKQRLEFLKSAAQSLSTVRYGLGLGAITKDRILFWRDTTHEKKLSLPERSSLITQFVLSSIDRQLWTQAPLVARATEFGVNVSLGLGAEGGVMKKGYGGQLDIGMSFGFNSESKSFVFQIYRNIEKFNNTIMGAMGYLGIAGKVGIMISNRTPQETMKPLSGSTFYPPGVPAYLSETPKMFSSGMSSGLGLPPPPFGDFLTVTNDLNHRTLLRVTVSPLVKGFIRVSIGANLDWMRLWLEPILEIAQRIQQRMTGTRLCRRVFIP